MSKNITIKEGAVARNFTGVKKLQTNVMGGGNQLWIPEDEAADYCTFKKITARENGTYKAEDEGCDGFSEVKVDIASDLKEKVIKVNGVYNASDDNCAGYKKVTVNVQGGGAGGERHTVIFYAADRVTILEKQEVEDGAGAIYHGVTPTASAMRFIGWTPNPINIKADTNCYPRFENLIYDPTQIIEDWVTIANNIRRNPDYYPIGAWKYLEIGEWDYGNVHYNAGKLIKMQLVAKGVDPLEGENGYAPTTWLSNDVFSLSQPDGTDIINLSPNNFDYFVTDFFKALTGDFTAHGFPQELLPYIRRIIKTTARYNVAEGDGQTLYTDYPSVEWFFIPSSYEMFGMCTDYATYFSQNEQSTGETGGTCYEIFCKDPQSGTPLSVADAAGLRDLGMAGLVAMRSQNFKRGIGQIGYPYYESNGGTIDVNAYYRNTTTGKSRLGFCL